jgi:membrane protein DedA with SNARE-associated domain/rhodanese-related sulfurtransferase
MARTPAAGSDGTIAGFEWSGLAVETLVALLMQHGASIVFVATLAARVGAPVPAGPLLVVAGGLSASGQLPVAAVFIAALVANLAGDALWFAGGRRYGHRIMRLLCRVSLSPDTCVRQSESLILRWGGSSLIAAKFVPGVSVVAAPMAGALAMPWRTFMAFDLAAAALWSSVFLGLGLLFRSQITQILDVMSGAGGAALAALALAIAMAVGLRFWRRWHARRALGLPRVGVGELRDLLRAGHDPVIIDVRSPEAMTLDVRIIPGARLVTLRDIAALATELPTDREVILYCDCPNEASAALAAQRLMALGVLRARPLAGGLDAWFAEEAIAQQAT